MGNSVSRANVVNRHPLVRKTQKVPNTAVIINYLKKIWWMLFMLCVLVENEHRIECA